MTSSSQQPINMASSVWPKDSDRASGRGARTGDRSLLAPQLSRHLNLLTRFDAGDHGGPAFHRGLHVNRRPRAVVINHESLAAGVGNQRGGRNDQALDVLDRMILDFKDDCPVTGI